MLCHSIPSRIRLVFVVMIVMITATIADSQSADAQGLLRRIQNRIQSRAQPTTQPRPTQPRLTQPRPTQAAPTPSDSRTPTAATPLRQVSPIAPSAGGDAADVSEEEFGSSILAAPGREPQPDAATNDDPAAEAASATRKNAASIGISVFDPEDGTPGIQVARFRDDSLADDAGLRVGDIIYAVNGRAIESSADVAAQLQDFAPGQRVALQVYRNRRPASLFVPLVARQAAPKVLADDAAPMISAAVPPEKALDDFDVSEFAAPERDLAPSDRASDRSGTVVAAKPIVDEDTGLINFGVVADDLRATRGAMVKQVLANSPADAAGIKKGDRVVSINGRLLMDSSAMERQLDGRNKGEQFSIQVVRNAKLMALEVRYDTPEANAMAKSDAKKAAATSDGGSITGGIGSMLGGLFGGKKTIPSSSEDEMAFDDAEPIRPVTFEEMTKAFDSPEKSDPPSLEVMELPAGKAEPVATPAPVTKAELADKDAADKSKLRKRIDELEAELNRLKAVAE